MSCLSAARRRTASVAALIFTVTALGAVGPIAPATGSPIELATPAGLNPGDTFRFAFVTSDYLQAVSTDIETYNTFVNTDAAGATYAGATVLWKVVGSTSAVNARDNVGGYGSSTPIYLVDGTRIANDLTTNTGGFWSGSLLTGTVLNMHLDGTTINDETWTGSNDDGTSYTGYVLGDGFSIVGDTNSTYSFINYDSERGTGYYYLYGMSADLTVPAAVPEIDPAGMGSVLALLIGGLGLLERRRLKTA